MLKKTITYENFNGETITEDFFFHLSEAELVELELNHSAAGGLKESLEAIIAAEDGKGIVDEFKNIIELSYGKKSVDGKRFTKSEEIREEFRSSGAYSALFMELVLNADSAVQFVNGIVPTGMADNIAKLTAVATEETPGDVTIVTRAEMETMSQEDLRELGVRIATGKVRVAE